MPTGVTLLDWTCRSLWRDACAQADAAIATVFPGGPYRRYCARRRDAVPAVAGVTCGDVYDNIDAAVAHTVRALEGAERSCRVA